MADRSRDVRQRSDAPAGDDVRCGPHPRVVRRPADPDQLAETIARLLASFVLLPVTVSVDLDDEAAARAYVRTVIAPLLTTRPAPPADSVGPARP